MNADITTPGLPEGVRTTFPSPDRMTIIFTGEDVVLEQSFTPAQADRLSRILAAFVMIALEVDRKGKK